MLPKPGQASLAWFFFFFPFFSFLCHYSSEFNLKEYPGEHWGAQRGFTYAYLLGPKFLLALQKASLSAAAACWENPAPSPGSYCSWPSIIDIPQHDFPRGNPPADGLWMPSQASGDLQGRWLQGTYVFLHICWAVCRVLSARLL